MIPSLESIQEARANIRNSAIRTPLVRLNFSEAPAEIYLKLENLQPIGSFKIRGAVNAMAHIPIENLANGVLTASAGNMAQGVAWQARKLGIPCTVIVPETAPLTKISAIERLGGRVVRTSFEKWWKTFEERSYPGISGTFVHAFDDPHVIAGNGTIGLEIVEDLPDVDAVIVPWGGGGLACGIAAAMRQLRPGCRVYAAEVETSTPLTSSLAAGSPQTVNYQPSFVDGMGAKTVFPGMFEMAKIVLEGTIVAQLEQVKSAVRLLAERNRIIAEGAGACPVACALAMSGKIVCIVSGGNINTDVLCSLLRDS
jgi:threonine dehydratase